MLENLQYLSILIEVVLAIMGLLIVFQKKKIYGYGIFLTFAIYVLYDLANLLNYSISRDLLVGLFFIGSLSALWAVFMIYNQKKK